MLVPMTLLAEQQLPGVSDRFADCATLVELLALSLDPKGSEGCARGLAATAIDLAIGTHS